VGLIGMKRILVRLLREPLLHFFAVGGLIFILYANGGDFGEASPDLISISSAQIDQLAAQFTSVWRRPPTDDELAALVDGYVREEVYYREALALGLDQNDAVVRQRMRQKIEFLTDIGAQMLDPTTDELQAYLMANDKKYSQGSRRAIEQIFLGQTPTPDDIARALQDLDSDPTRNTSAYSEPSLLPAELGLSLPEAIDSVYGNGFFEQIENFPVGQWSGPVVSAYGVHLVRVLDNQAAQSPSLADMRAAVLRDWQADKAKELRELDYIARKERFTIQIYGREEQTEETP
jgi:hypothetical protein